MKISIWQQFSSNHSSSYTIVGQFSSPDEATKVEQQLSDWVESWSNERCVHKDGETPTQITIKSKYNVEFDLDYNDFPYRPVQCFDRYVLMESGSEAWGRPDELAKLLEKMGASRSYNFTGDDNFSAIVLKFTIQTSNKKLVDKLSKRFMWKPYEYEENLKQTNKELSSNLLLLNSFMITPIETKGNDDNQLSFYLQTLDTENTITESYNLFDIWLRKSGAQQIQSSLQHKSILEELQKDIKETGWIDCKEDYYDLDVICYCDNPSIAQKLKESLIDDKNNLLISFCFFGLKKSLRVVDSTLLFTMKDQYPGPSNYSEFLELEKFVLDNGARKIEISYQIKK